MYTIPTSQRKWMCPNHIGRDLTQHRRKRNSKIVDVSLRRGFVNNGDIEVDNESSEDDLPEEELLIKPSRLHFIDGWEDAPFGAYSDLHQKIDFEEFNIDGIVYRLPERGIVLDFLDRVNL